MRSTLVLVSGLALVVSSCAPTTRAPTLGAAASLRRAMPRLAEAYERVSGAQAPEITYGASGKLARQVEAGAPLDGVILASAAEVDRLVDEGLAEEGSRVVLATNQMVLARRSGDPERSLVEVADGRLPGRLAIGDPRFVPAGRHAQALLEARGLWGASPDHLVVGGHVAAVLAYLQSGAVDAAIVYATDIHGRSDLTGVVLSGGDLPRPSVVGARVLGGNRGAQVMGFFRFIGSADGQRVLRAHGFGPPE